MLSNRSSSFRFNSASLLATLALGAGTAMGGTWYTTYVGTYTFVSGASGGVWKTTTFNHAGTEENIFEFGGAGMRPIVGDWDGDGNDTAGVYDPATGVFFLRNSNSSGAPDEVLTLNGPGAALPISGDFDGD